jgi:hypothetical protein
MSTVYFRSQKRRLQFDEDMLVESPLKKLLGFPLGTLDPRRHRPSQTGPAFNLRLDKRRRRLQLQRPMAKWPPRFINWVTGFASVGVLFLLCVCVLVFVMSKEIHQITVVACCSHEPPNRQIITNRCIYVYNIYILCMCII